MSRIALRRDACEEDRRICVGDHIAEQEAAEPIELVLTMRGIDNPLCHGHAKQLHEMLSEELLVSGSADAVVASGICTYDRPDHINIELVDELIRPVVVRINQSGWVWTGESCQGHPDATHAMAWAGNTRPMLRLIAHQERYGEMLNLLLGATHYEEDGLKRTVGLDMWEHERKGVYCEVIVYAKATTVYERNVGIECFARFAEAIN